MASIMKNNRSKRGGWIIDYYDLSGSRKRKVVHCSRKEAEILANELESSINKIRLGLASSINKHLTIPEAVKYYFSRRSKAEKTIDRENWVYKAFMKFVGPVKVTAVNQQMIIEYFKVRKKRDGLTDAGLGIEFRTLRAFFNFLVEQKYIEESPVKGVKIHQPKPKPIRFLCEDEINCLLKVVEDEDIRDVILFYIHTGARAREIDKSVFTWKNVNFKERKIIILGKGSKYRTVPMNDVVYEILVKRKEKNLKVPFPMDYDYIYKRVKKGYKEAGIKDANLHALRRTFGSLLIQRGVNIYIVSKLMGHESVTLTERHYLSLVDENLRDGVEHLNDLKF